MTTKTAFVKPAFEGLKVHKPEGGWINPEGETVPLSIFYRRRIDDGDLVVSEPKKTGSDKK